jgi:Cysteine-rich CPXCG
MRILFLHGWHSVPGGVKPTYLKEAGHDVINPALDDDDFELAVRFAQQEYDLHQPDVIVGSSRGGAVAMNIESSLTPLVLLCPAWRNWGTVKTIKPNSVILHSRNDDVIPFADSEELIRNSSLRPESLIETGNDHRLADDESLSVMLWVCNLLKSGEQVPWIEDSEHDLPATPFGKSKSSSAEEASYLCDGCGEEIVIPLDLTEGSIQSYVEDCPVCCRANVIHVHIDDEGNAQVWAEPEQDRD